MAHNVKGQATDHQNKHKNDKAKNKDCSIL